MLRLPLKRLELEPGAVEGFEILSGKPYLEMSTISLRWVAQDGLLAERDFSVVYTQSARQANPNALVTDHNSLHSHCWSESITMDENIWTCLPYDLHGIILARLPLSSVLRFRSVCRQWNSLILSKAFLTTLSELSERRPWFLICTMGKLGCVFDPAVDKWLTIAKPAWPGTTVIASAGSLLCLGNQVSECKTLALCNPITGSLRKLPQMPHVRLIHKVSMIEERRTNSYRIVVAGEDGTRTTNNYTYNLLTEVYYSSTNTWSTAGSPLPSSNFGSDPGAWCNDAFYSITELPYGVARFDIKTLLWTELDVPMPSRISLPSLVSLGSRLLMVGKVMDDADNNSRVPAICIWELHQAGREWIELKALPESISSKLLAPLATYSPFVCAAIGNNTIFITSHSSPRVLVYDVVGDSWRWLASDPLFPRNRDMHLLGFAFEARFDACP